MIIIGALLLVLLYKPRRVIKPGNFNNNKTVYDHCLSVLDYIPVLRWNRTGIIVAGQTGINSTNSTHLNCPWGLAIDYENTLFVVDHRNNRVQKFLKDSLVGITVAGQANGAKGSNNISLNSPATLFLDSNHDLYIADSNNNRIQLWKNNANSGMTIAGIGKIYILMMFLFCFFFAFEFIECKIHLQVAMVTE